MFIIADIAGTQEKLEKGMKLKVPTLDCEVGKTKKFDSVLLVDNEGDVKIGAPYVDGANVELTVLSHGRGDKIIVRKMKRRKRYRRTQGHRQGYTEVEVSKITA